MILIESAGLSEIGKKRRENEDRLLVDDELRLYVVADGMGGHQAGAVASQMAVDTLQRYFAEARTNGNRSHDGTDARLSLQANRLLKGICLSNQLVHNSARANAACRGMGTTLAAVNLTEDTIIAANVGDSPIFLVRGGDISQISVTHTLLAELDSENDRIAQRISRQYRHVLTRAIGTRPEVKVDIVELQCFRDDVLVIGSDGLTDKASPAEIQSIVLSQPPRGACRQLIDLANARGGDDNITAVVIRVLEVKPTQRIRRFFRGRLRRLWRRHA